MEFIAIAIVAVIAYFIAKDASARGMNAAGWGISSFLLCIVAVPIYLIVRKPLLASTPTPETHVRCPDCKELVRKDAKICKHCHCKLVPVDDYATAITAQPPKIEAQPAPETMDKYGITFDGERYCFGEFRYDKYADALAYAQRQR